MHLGRPHRHNIDSKKTSMSADSTVSEDGSPRDALLRAASFASAPCSECKAPVSSPREWVDIMMSRSAALSMNGREETRRTPPAMNRVVPHMPTPMNRMDEPRQAMNGGDCGTAHISVSAPPRDVNPAPSSYIPHRKRKAITSETSPVVHHHPPDTSKTATQVKIGKTLLIAYFPWEASKEDISNEFSRVCNVKKVHLVCEKTNVRPRCFGFVKFMSRADAFIALDFAQRGLITLNDSRGHVWHLKAEWTRTRDMMDDDEDGSLDRQMRKTRPFASANKKSTRRGAYGMGSCAQHRKCEDIKTVHSAEFEPAYVVLS